VALKRTLGTLGTLGLLLLLCGVGHAAVSIVTTSLPGVTIGVPYSQQLVATGGVLPYVWSLDSGTLPAGLSLSSSGLISGTPTALGTSNFVVRVTDSAAPLPVVSLTAPSAGNVSGVVTVTATCTSALGVAGVTFYYFRQGTGLQAIGSEDTSSPYSVSWDTKLVPNGAYSVTAVCRDTSGNTISSSTVSVTNISGPTPPTGMTGVPQ